MGLTSTRIRCSKIVGHDDLAIVDLHAFKVVHVWCALGLVLVAESNSLKEGSYDRKSLLGTYGRYIYAGPRSHRIC